MIALLKASYRFDELSIKILISFIIEIKNQSENKQKKDPE
jgi:hypothetical protein